MATLESTAFLALGFGAVNGQDFRTRRDLLGRFTLKLFLISQLVSGSRVSLTQGRAGPAGVETAGREHGSCNHASGLQSDLLVVEARARGPFFWASATKKWTIIDWKVTVSKPALIHGEHQSPAQWPRTRIFPGKTKLVLQPRSSTQTYNQEPNNIQQTYTKPTCSRQATDQPKRMVEREVHLECLGASVERPV